MTGEEETPVEYTAQKYFDFTFNEEDKTAQVTGINENYKSDDGAILDGSTKITSVAIPKSVKNDSGEDYTVTAVAVGAFYECGLEEVIFPDRVTTIGSSAFDSCTGLRELTILGNVQEIGGYAFANCYNLEKIIYLGTQEPSIEENAFYNVLASVQVPKEYCDKMFGSLPVEYLD